MRPKLACSCLFGALFLFGSSGSANVQHGAVVPLRPSLIDKAIDKVASLPGVEKAMVKLASLPGAAESFLFDLGAPEVRELEGGGSIDAPKDSPPTPLERARAALAQSDAPPLSRNELCLNLVDVAQANELPLGFFTNLIWRESRFDHEAISPVGAMGIAQFMPDVADKYEINAFDGREALPASARLLRTLYDRFGNLGLAAAAYNAGPKRRAGSPKCRAGSPKRSAAPPRRRAARARKRTSGRTRTSSPRATGARSASRNCSLTAASACNSSASLAHPTRAFRRAGSAHRSNGLRLRRNCSAGKERVRLRPPRTRKAGSSRACMTGARSDP